MLPIHALLNRIRWDKDYASAAFSIAYYDRIENAIIEVPFADVCFDEDDHFAFYILNHEGEYHHIPYHRVKSVYRNGEQIWHRKH